MPGIDEVCSLKHEYKNPKEESYIIAINRTFRSRRIYPLDSDIYERAKHLRHVIDERRSQQTQSMLETCLYRHIERWKEDTIHWSSMTEMLAHPSYLRIVGMAGQLSKIVVARALLQELQTEPDYWFDALAAITGEDPVLEEHDFDEAVNAWLGWGRTRGLI